ncbi:MAG: UDP-N-acetylmuramate--L-alanine ligase [Phycisphaerae bacterium]|nr:UDP-N-acetylmuramate--L-alanine ligase [Phycisphaerae bacterium]
MTQLPTNQALSGIALDEISLRHRNVHLIGVGGSGMSGAARLLLQHGARVTGSDHQESPILQQLSGAGATIYIGHDHRNLADDAALVVISAAVPADNPEVLAARAKGKPVIKYSQLLGLIMKFKRGVAVAGTHGKSTTTAWTAYLGKQCGLDPSFVVGAEVTQLGGASAAGHGDHFVVEACEYDSSFLNFAPQTAAVLNIDEDHLDYFRDLEHIIEVFSQFVAQVPDDGLVLLNQDDLATQRITAAIRGERMSFGFHQQADWQASDLHWVDGLPSFVVRHHQQALGRVTLSIPGRHNVYNALAAMALAEHCGAALPDILQHVGSFTGAGRRLSYLGECNGVTILDDYAHHPAEIRASLAAVRQRYLPERLWVIFQPHQHSRTRFFLNDFADSFQLADEVVVPDIYFVRDSEVERQLISSRDLVERIQHQGHNQAHYIPNLQDIADFLAGQTQPGDVVITMGAGDVWKVAHEMVSRIRSHH